MKQFTTNCSDQRLTLRRSRIMTVTLFMVCISAVYAQKKVIQTYKKASLNTTVRSAGSARTYSSLNTLTTFGCQDGVSYRIQGDNSALYTVNLRTGATALLFNATQLGNRDLTALGYNPLDNFLYASVSGTNDIVKIGTSGVIQQINVPGLPNDTYEAGDVSPNGILYLYSSGASIIRKVTLSNLAVSSISLDAGDNLQDISISPDGLSIYGIDADDGDLVRYAITGGARTSTNVGLSDGSTATYIDETGDLYVIKDVSSSVFEIVGPGNPKAKSATQLTTANTTITKTDGARCIKSSATTQTPFVCTAGRAFAVVGTKGYKNDECNDLGNSKLAEYNLQNGTLITESGQLINSFNSRTTVNNMGYNVKDNFLWAYRNGTNQLIRIGSERTVDFFAISGLSSDCTYGSGTNNTVFTAGDVNSDGVLYLFNGFNGDRFIRVDLNPSSGTYLQKLSDIVISGYDPSNTQVGVDDFGFNPVDNKLYGVDGNNHLIRVNPATGAATDIGIISGLPDSDNYLSAFFDNAGTLYVQTSNSNNTYKIPNVATDDTPNATKFIDNGATVGSNGDGARCPYSPVAPTYTISGTVFNDANGLVDGIVNGTAVSSLAGNTFWVNLAGPNNTVLASTTLTSGNFSFTGVNGSTTYSVILSRTQGTLGSAPPSTTLTGGVVNTGEHIGDGVGSDGTPNGVISVSVAASSVTDVNLGVERLPTADPKTAASQPNPGGTTKVTVPILTGSDPEDGPYTGTSKTNTIVIKSLPPNGTLYYNNSPVNDEQVITSYDPSKLTLDPNDGPISVTFTYAERDAANKESSPAIVTMPFTSNAQLAISGTVFNDANGLVDGIVNGTAVSSLAGNTFWVNLVGSVNTVLASTTLTSGNYSFTGLTANTSYSIVLSRTQGSVGSAPPSTTLTGSVVNTGEHIGDGAGSDGSPNGIISVSLASSSVADVNLGVERLPTADPKTAPNQPNPGGANTVVVPTLTGSDPEDGTYVGTTKSNTVIIQSLPTNATLYYNGLPVTMAGQVIPNYDPSLLAVDPINGSVTVTFTYSERDAAGLNSPPALVTMPFVNPPDLTPLIYARPSTVYNTTGITVVVDVLELLSVPTSGTIVVKVTKDTKVSLTFPPTAELIENRPVKNSVWTLNNSDPNYYVLTTSQVVAAGDVLSFGFTGVLTPGATSGTLTISTVIVGGSGGEIRLNNNVDADKIDYFQK